MQQREKGTQLFLEIANLKRAASPFLPKVSWLEAANILRRRTGYALCGKRIERRTAQGEPRRYIYYRCVGSNPARFGGQRLCRNRPVPAGLLETAVWNDVCALLAHPGKTEEEYQRRLSGVAVGSEAGTVEALTKRIQQVKRSIARLIDAYGEGLLDKNEFEPRIRSAKERLSTLEAEAGVQVDHAYQEQELRLVITRLQEFAAQVHDGLDTANGETRREVIRALVRRVEVDENQIKIVYRVNAPPFAKAPESDVWQDCLRRGGSLGE